jgi:anti-sigma factor ChrR (cupin superfamily)
MAGFATIAALDEHSFVYGCLHPTASAAPAASGGSAPAASGGAVPEKLVEECKKAGEAVAAAKKSGASKDEIQAKVEKLLALKKQITALDANHALAIVDKKKKAKGTAAPEEKKGLSKREQKRLARGEDVKKKKKDKDPNRWAVDPAKAAAKAEKARLKALAKAEAEKADVRTPRLRVASMARRFHDVTR